MVIFVVISYYAYRYENNIKNKKSIGGNSSETLIKAIKKAKNNIYEINSINNFMCNLFYYCKLW